MWLQLAGIRPALASACGARWLFFSTRFRIPQVFFFIAAVFFAGFVFFVLFVPCCCLLYLLGRLLAQVLFSIMNDDTSDEDTRIAELSACRWPIPAPSEQAPSPTASAPYADAHGTLDPPVRSIEVNVRVSERSICFFDITSGHTIQDLLDASEDPGCASVTTCFRVTHITVHTTAIALGCAERPPDFITPPTSDDEV